MPDIWDEIASNVAANTSNLATTSIIAKRRNPALVARARKLSIKYGVPSPIIEEQPEPYELQDLKDTAEGVFDQHPWMPALVAEDPGVGSILTKDDLPKLGDISNIFGVAPDRKAFSLDRPAFALPDLRGTPAPPQAPPLPSYGKRVLTTTGAVLGVTVNQLIGAAAGIGENVTDVVGLNDELDPFYRDLEDAQTKANQGLMSEVSGWVTPGVKQGAFSAAVSLTQLGTTMGLTGGAAVLPMLTGITYGNAYQKYQGKDLGIGKSMLGAALEGGLEYATERLPVGYLTGKLGKGTTRDFFTHFVLGETLGEQIATAGQSLTETMLTTDQSFGEWLQDPQRGQDAWETLVATTLMAGVVGGSHKALKSLAATSDKAVDTTDGLIGQTLLDKVMENAENVELRANSPDDFARFVNEGAKDSIVKNVYLPIEAIDKALNDDTLPAEEKAALSFYQDQIDEARITNSEVVIPIGNAAAHFAGTKLWQSLREDARVLAGGISGREAKENMATIVAEMEAVGKQALDEVTEAAPALVAKAKVYSEVKAQVLASGRTAKEAETTAVLLAARAETLASGRYGKFKDAAAAWKWMQLSIVGPDAKTKKRGAQKVAQDSHPTVNIGLDVNDGSKLTPEEAVAALKAMGVDVVQQELRQSNTEQTLIARLSRALTPEEGDAVSTALRQDAIAQRVGDVGELYGPSAEAWGPFNPDFFLDLTPEPEPILSTTVFQQSNLPDKDVPASLAGALEIARGSKFANIREFKLVVQKAVTANKANLRERKRVVRLALTDAVQALQSNANAVGWYNDKVVRALEVFSAIHPEIGTDENAKFAFIYALAVTSNGLKVDANFKLADKVYRAYKKTGQMPIMGEGTAGGAMQDSLALFNDLVEQHGIETVRDFMQRRDITVKEVETFTGTKVTGENKGTKVTGAAFLGPKIGNGFFANLYGNYDQLTMDRWFIRTWGRWTGTLITQSPVKAKQKREVVKNILRNLTPAQKKRLNALLSTKRDPFVAKLTDIDGFAKRLTVATSKKHVRDELKAIDPTDRLRLDTKALHVMNDGQKEAPQGPKERDEIRSIMVPVLQELKRENPDLTMADLQAVLWYPEKTLYDTARAKVGVSTSEGYGDDEAPDYANAAVALARSEGIPEEKIREAQARADRRLAAAQRPAGTGRGAGVARQPRIPEDEDGFPAEDVLVSIDDGTLDPMVLQQFGGVIGAANGAGVIGGRHRAENMLASGMPKENVWRLTGWMRGDDGLWRFEIDDSPAEMLELPSGDAVSMQDVTPGIDYDYGTPTMGASDSDGSLIYIGAKLDQVLHHPKLFEHYPILRQIGVFNIPLNGNHWGYFDGFNIVLNSEKFDEKQTMSTILHEVQHAIQSIEGFTNGASPALDTLDFYGLMPEYEAELAHQMAILNGEVPGWKYAEGTDPVHLQAYAAHQVYHRVLGEVEARNTQKRQALGKSDRREHYPDWTADVPPEQRLIPMVEPMRMVASSQQGPQGPTKTPRGEASFYPDGRTVVQLFARADFSTMLHEMSHVFLQQEFTLAQDPKASDELKKDVETLTKWFEAHGGTVKNGIPDTAAHELFARTGERYFREGKAPSAELRSAFKQFRTWLTDVYKSVRELLAFGPAPISPEISEIMDRMIATNEAIEANAIAPLSQDELGMSDEEYAAYLDSVNVARDDAYDILLDRMMKAINQRETKKGRELRANIRAEIAAQVNKEPRFIALHLLRTGRWLGDAAREPVDIKLNSGWLIDNYGEGVLQQLPVGLRPIHRGDGVVGDVIADMVGFSSGDELVHALIEMKQQADKLKADGNPRPLRDQIIEDATDKEMAERYGDIAMSEEDIREEAIAALNANRQGEVLATELRQLKRKGNDKRPNTPYELLREWARRKVNEGTVSEAISKSALQRYVRGFNKARNLFEQALLGKNAQEAIKQKQAQMINHALLAEGKKVADEINTIVRRMQRYASVKAMASIDQDYMDHIHELLEGYSFRNVSDAKRAEKVSFEAWAEGQRKLGHEVYVPERFRDDRTNWKDARVSKLLELNDMVQSLVAQGKLKQRLTNAKAERELAAAIDEIESRILDLPQRKQSEASTGEENRPFRQAMREAKTFAEYRAAVGNLFSRKKLREAATGLIKIEGLMDILDGTKDASGPLNQIVVQGATEAANKYSDLMEQVMQPLVDMYRNMPKKMSARLRDFVTIHELSLNVSVHEADSEKLGKPLSISRMQLLGLILNTGNLSNLAKLVGGERWGDPESAADMARVRDILVSYASKEDMDMVQSLWDGVGKLWPHIAEVERQLSGVVPEQVIPVEFDTPHGRYSGGYWPVVWDSTRSEMGRRQGEEAETSLQGVGFGISTPKGHTITRTGAVAPMEWSVENVLFNHLNKVISRISYAPWVRDVLKVVDNPRVTGAIRLRLGGEYVSAIKPWIRDQIPANSIDTKGAKAWEKFLDQFRINMSIAVLGISYTTGIAQTLGLGYSAGVLGEGSVKAGGRWVASGMYEMIKLQKAKMGGAQEFVFARSLEMQRRAQELNQEVHDVFMRLKDNDTLYNRLQAAAFWHIGFIDMNMVALPTWLGGYNKAISQGMTDDEASAYGDKMVRLSQGSGRKKDMAAIQRGTAGQKFIAMFYTPSSVFFNQQWEAAQHIKAGNWSKALAPTFWFLVATTIADAMREGDWPEDDDEDGLGLGDISEWVGRNLLFGAFYGVPIARDVANASERKMRGEYAEYGSTPLTALTSAVVRGAKSVAKIGDDEKEFEGRDLKNTVNAMGYLLGLPGSQIGKTSGFIKDVYDGRVEPETAGDWYRGLAYGKPPSSS